MVKKNKDLSEDAGHHAGGNPHQPPPPPPEIAPYQGIETTSVWTKSLTSTVESPTDPLTLTYSFPDSASDYGKGYSEANKFVAFVGAEQSAYENVISQYEKYDLINLVLKQGASDSTADIRIGKTVTQGADAWSYYPGSGKGGDTWYNINAAGTTNGGKGGMDWAHLEPGDYTYTVFMHEFGHSVGLKHSFENSGAGAVPKAYDSLEYTVMSYDAYQTSNPFDSTAYDSSVDQRNWWADNGNNPQTLMMLDIAALQDKYGVDYGTNSGDTTYMWDPLLGGMAISPTNPSSPTFSDAAPHTRNIFMTLWDGGGIDTYNFSNYSVGISIDLRPGHWVTIDYNSTDPEGPSQRADLLAGAGEHWATGNIANALVFDWNDNAPGAGYIENAIGGGGNDLLIGNAITNILTGGSGADRFYFGRGQANGDTVTDFHQSDSDKLYFTGFNIANAQLNYGSDDAWIVHDGTHADETIHLAGVSSLGTGDYTFA